MKKNIELLKPLVLFIQETLHDKKGCFKKYLIFENIRQNKGGCIITGAHVDLKPVLISDGSQKVTEV